MRVALLPGIWPPDVGGPATHGPDFARFLIERGHSVRVVTMSDGEPTDRPCPIVTVPRRGGFALRYPRLTAAAAREARRADVVYATATYAAAAGAAAVTGRGLVVKLVSDPAFERARRYGLFTGPIDAFQRADGLAVRALKRARTAALARATTIVVPSRYLADIARRWRLDPDRIVVLPNPAPDVVPSAAGRQSGRFVFAGRLTHAKALGDALAALARVPAARLDIVGDGPEREDLERRAREHGLNGRVRFLGARPRDEVVELLACADAAVLPSVWENFPHAAVEALAVGTPVVATRVGGVPEIVRDGENGLLVRAGAPDELAAALARLLEEPGLRDRLAAAARPSVAPLARGEIYGRLAALLEDAAA